MKQAIINFFVKDLKWFFVELIKTFSNEPSFFASKRWERWIMFSIAMWLIIGYTVRKWNQLTTTEVLELAGMLLIGGAWNATQIRKDITLINNPKNDKSEP